MTPETTHVPAIRLHRTIAAAPHEVYRAWLDPDILRRWFAGGGMAVARVEVDERVGGHHRTWQTGPDGDAGGFDAELVELVPDERLVFLWRFVGPERVADPSSDSRLTITFAEAPRGATALTLVHERLDGLRAAMPHVADAVPAGWGQALDKLEAALAAV
ncbi:MAG TPA: SRPBCC domain-containing protein [Baekduia sp.]|uniref:SRPBCC family protein n=1 Tax=Baekduia sp. TaxID=2600305 RepID=UPI002CD27494|nr:SRPBCC domain-containing protein [Baekduia sp.]HMJ35754.1 SRPBCC domain-containing protein [Baekduia sp.]